ncbi:Zn-ribbon domain-containing OB-fold protein [Salinilacihabitans rarus]|uniref:Zn-ribbon domain-containing OB-fold protein n=1 Tax=Salinilacihabitans rarus TaxID=2961596 RepID=UPI0020C8ADF9|nr:OB-fold domain-containing protein [Salinilacihabitans rarus]
MSDDERVRDADYDDWLDAVETDEAFYIECPEGHGLLPPRRICPDCASTELVERPLPETGVIETFTVVHVPTPSFADDAPYATAVADFGPVRLTGQVTGVDPDDVEEGLAVGLTVGISETSGDRLLTFPVREE